MKLKTDWRAYMLSYQQIFSDVTTTNPQGKRIGILVNEKPEYKEKIQELRLQFNQFTEKICPENCKVVGMSNHWSMSHRDGLHFKPYFWNQFEYKNTNIEGISIWARANFRGVALSFGTTNELTTYNNEEVNQMILALCKDIKYDGFETLQLDGFLSFLYNGDNAEMDINVFKKIIEDLEGYYRKILELLPSNTEVDNDYEEKGFRNYLSSIAKQDNGEPYAKATIDTYVYDLKTILHVLKKVDSYTNSNKRSVEILDDFIAKKETDNLYLAKEFFSAMQQEQRTDTNLYASITIKGKKYLDYIKWKNSMKSTNKPLNQIKNILLYGVPGVGKTHNINKLISLVEDGLNQYDIFEEIEKNTRHINGEKNLLPNERIRFVTFHQNFGYEDFIEGFRPNENGDIKLQEGIFKSICEDAKENRDENFYLVIDEINRGNISKIFGELITLIEEDKRDAIEVMLPYSKKLFTIPSNVFIIGTMNSTDKSIALIDIALRRRFTFVKMKPNGELINHSESRELLKVLNQKITEKLGEDYQIGHSYFMKIENDADFSFVIKYKIKPLLEEYFYGDTDGLNDVLSLLEQ